MRKHLPSALFFVLCSWLVAPGLAAREGPADMLSRYLTHWQSGDYSKMYDMLSSRSKILTSRWEFIRTHEKMESCFTIIDFEVYDQDINGDEASVQYSLTVKELFGKQRTQKKRARLLKERGLWMIDTAEKVGQ